MAVRGMPTSVLRRRSRNLNGRAGALDVWEAVGLSSIIVVLLAITAASLAASHFWDPAALRHAPWCGTGQVPRFEFGFAELADAIGDVMGAPIECEHGEDSSVNTLQATTTGIARYYWCTNTPSFTRGQEHWMLTPKGVEHWTGDADPPRPLPVVRAADLRSPCMK